MPVELKIASYKKVEFLFISATTTGGIKRKIFSFPNTNRQSIEEFGTSPRSFQIEAIIPFKDYEENKAALISVLESGGAGRLTHPTFGAIDNVKSGAYTINETLSELGRAKVTMQFDIDNAAGIPQQALNSVSQVDKENQELADGLNTNLEDNWDVTSVNNYADAQESVNSVSDTFNSALKSTGQAIDKVNSYKRELDTFTESINTLISEPKALADSIRSLYVSMGNLYEAPSDSFNAFKSMFNFGDNDPVVEATTTDLKERNKNRDILRGNMKNQALGYAYVAAADTEYQTVDEIDSVNDALEEQYLNSVDQDIDNASVGDLNDLRAQANATLADLRISARRTITINVKRTPLSVLAYKYYGSTDLVNTLQQLNNIEQISFVEGEIRILTS